MPAFSDLELAALNAIFDESPEIADLLRRQLEAASVTARENTGGGFITTIEVPDGVREISIQSALGYDTEASINGLAHGLGFAFLMKNGRLDYLDGYSQGGENTTGIDFEKIGFSICKTSSKD